MNTAKVLGRAIQKAVDNGWNMGVELSVAKDGSTMFSDGERTGVYDVIFNHDFAKALWGEEYKRMCKYDPEEYIAWEHHLQQMVIAEDPIKYLEKHM